MEGEPFTQPEARGRIRRIVASGLVLISDYTKSRMQERGVTMEDIRGILRVGQVEPAEWENGSWRYRVSDRERYCVIRFFEETVLLVVTVWR